MASTISRRSLLAGSLGAVGVATLGGCAGLTRPVASTERGRRDRLTFQTYGTDTETAVYRRLARRFEAQHRGITVDVTVVPFVEASTGIDAALLAGTAPDVFRVDYPSMGVYAATDQLLDITSATRELASDVSATLMDAVTEGDRVYGIPQHVDTSALIFRPDALRRAGITSVPDRLEDAWSWEELTRVADRLHDTATDGASALAVNWQGLGAFRWLNFLFQAGGHVHDPDLRRATVDTEPGRRALEFTRSFFERGWTPANASTKAATYPDALFTAGRLGMLYAGNFLLPAFTETIGRRFDYRATFLPRDERSASELGGNALVATKQAGNPELAAEFLTFLAQPHQMRDFCEAATLLPTRRSLLEQRLDFDASPELMPVYAAQITTIEARDVADVTTPTFAQVNDALTDELDECFLSGRAVDPTLQALSDQIDEAARLNDGASR